MTEARELEKPGVYENVPEDVYNAIRAMRRSDLDHYLESDSNYFYQQTAEKKETDATRLGSATHHLVLQPQTFYEKYCLEPDLLTFGRNKPTKKALNEDPNAVGERSKNPRGTEAYKAEMQTMNDDGFTVLQQDAWDETHRMGCALEDHPNINEMLAASTGREVTIVWMRDGLLCKARLDVHGADQSNPVAVDWIMDLKTTRDLPGYIPWQFQQYGTHRQAAWYQDGAYGAGLFQYVSQFYLGVVANYGPNDTLFAQVDQISLTLGRAQNDWLWKRHLACMKSGEWVGRFDHAGTVSATVDENFYNRAIERMEEG